MNPIKTTIDNVDVVLKLHFIYPHKHSSRRRKVIAIVRIFLPGGDYLRELTGEATCNLDEGDRFDKETGRRVALRRALAQSDLRELRSEVWAEYWGRFN